MITTNYSRRNCKQNRSGDAPVVGGGGRMNTFTQLYRNQRLYTCNAPVGDFLLILPNPGPATITGVDAWTNATYAGRLVYAATGAGVTQDNAEAYVARVLQITGGSRAMMRQEGDQFRYWTMDRAGQRILSGMTVEVAPQLSYVVPGSVTLKYTDAAIQLGTSRLRAKGPDWAGLTADRPLAIAGNAPTAEPARG